MKKQILFVVLILINSVSTDAQNLVPNPGFEEHNACQYWVPGPSGFPIDITYSPSYDSFPTVLYWVTPLVNNTPDYFNICDTTFYGHGIPNSFVGYQSAHSGNSHIGEFMYCHRHPIINDYREYVEAKLIRPLIFGHEYHIHFYVNLAAPHITMFYGRMISVDNIGAYISDTMVLDSIGYANAFLTNPTTIHSMPGVFITDTTYWTKIEGSYTAHGGEQWITLGHFNGAEPPKDTFLYTIGSITYPADSFTSCYMYIDDVCVMDITNNITDTTICTAHLPYTLHGFSVQGNYLWSTGDTIADITVMQPGIYWRRATGDCLYHVDTFRLKTIPAVDIGNDRVICKEPQTYLNSGIPLVNYLWNTGDTVCCIPIDSTGLYSVTAYNECGIASDSVHITVLSPCENCLLVPSAFTPNDDGRNDVFRGVIRCAMAEYKFSVYNRYGQRIFLTTESDKGWDGKLNGTPQDAGVYFYYIAYKTTVPGAKQEQAKGTVTLVR